MAKELTVREMASMGGRARARKCNRQQIRAWGKLGGRPSHFDGKALARLERLLRGGKNQAECAVIFGLSVRTIGRAVARLQPRESMTPATVHKWWTRAEVRKMIREAEDADIEFPPLAGPR